MPIAFENIKTQNQDNIGGIPAMIYYFIHEDVEAFPELVKFDTITTLAGANKLTGALDMLLGKKIYELDITFGKGGIKEPIQGEVGGKSHKHELSFELDSMSDRNQGFMRVSNNGKFGFLIPDLDKGWFRAFGCTKHYPAFKEEGEGGTGEGGAGKKGGKFTFVLMGSGPVPILELTPAQLAALLAPAT
jgi:hypothetical protein